MLAIAVVAAIARPVRSQNVDSDVHAKSRATAAEGQQLYSHGKFIEAAERFAAANDLEPDPAYLFNPARAYRFGNACAKAADYSRRFLAAVPNPPSPDKLHRYIDDMDACVKKQQVLLPVSGEPAPPPNVPSEAPA